MFGFRIPLKTEMKGWSLLLFLLVTTVGQAQFFHLEPIELEALRDAIKPRGEVRVERVVLDGEEEGMDVLLFSLDDFENVEFRAFGAAGYVAVTGTLPEGSGSLGRSVRSKVRSNGLFLGEEAHSDSTWDYLFEDDGSLWFISAFDGAEESVVPAFNEAITQLSLSLNAPVENPFDPSEFGLGVDDLTRQMRQMNCEVDLAEAFRFDEDLVDLGPFCDCLLSKTPGYSVEDLSADDVERVMRSCWPAFPSQKELTSVCLRKVAAEFRMFPAEVRSALDEGAYCECQVRNFEDFDRFMRFVNRESWDLTCIATLMSEERPMAGGLPALMELMFEVDNQLSSVCDALMSLMPGQIGIRIPEGREIEICSCMFSRMVGQGMTDYQDLLNPDSPAMVEVFDACVADAGLKPARYNTGLSGWGCSGMMRVPVVPSSKGYRLKLSVGGTERYVVIDSGASELFINRDWLELIEQRVDVVRGVHYSRAIIADGSEVVIEVVRLPEIEIGNCTMRNVYVGVMDQGGMLCGLGFLELFGGWRIDAVAGELVLGGR